ncbi:group II truncated hemoglobin [Tsukamurella spumae]|uniref:Globin n=1 Tax=Tsukamurella spumae TaxID=44753 RepID=A0A846X4K2_9ACTN|nr:group II truncated hemoglobin [Tsukamurella spumae]NKY20063.1 globin [Tsukamurella spumae]
MTSLYTAMGGSDRIRLATELFLRKAMEDDLLADMFAGKFDHAEHIAAFFSATFGGPQDYVRERGGLADVLARHVGLNITEEQRLRWKAYMIESAREAKIPEEAVAVFAGYLEGPSRNTAAISNLPAAEAYARLGRDPQGRTSAPV